MHNIDDLYRSWALEADVPRLLSEYLHQPADIIFNRYCSELILWTAYFIYNLNDIHFLWIKAKKVWSMYVLRQNSTPKVAKINYYYDCYFEFMLKFMLMFDLNNNRIFRKFGGTFFLFDWSKQDIIYYCWHFHWNQYKTHFNPFTARTHFSQLTACCDR